MEAYTTVIYGEKYTAKSSLALTWPKPIAYYDLEYGAHRAWGWKKRVESGEVVPRYIDIPKRSLFKRYENLKGFNAGWMQLIESIVADCDDEKVRTIVIDTGSEVRALAIDAFLEERQKDNPSKKTLDPIEYAEPNRRSGGLYQAIRSSGKDLVVLYHETEKYVNDKPSGEIVPDGDKYAGDRADWMLRMRLIMNGVAGPIPVANIEKMPGSFVMLGQDIEWPTYEQLEGRLKMVGG